MLIVWVKTIGFPCWSNCLGKMPIRCKWDNMNHTQLLPRLLLREYFFEYFFKVFQKKSIFLIKILYDYIKIYVKDFKISIIFLKIELYL
jgi:hypothetical protein